MTFRSLAAACLLLGGACAAEDADAPPPVPAPGCPRLDSYLEGFYALLDQGKLESVRAFLSEELSADLRSDLVATLIRLVDAFDPGTFSSLGEVAPAADQNPGFQAVLADVLRFAAATGPGAPYPKSLASIRSLLASCELEGVLALGRDALADQALLAAFAEALRGGALDLGTIAESLGIDLQDKEAVGALLRTLLVAAADPSFDLPDILGLLGALVDLTKPPYDALAEALTALLGPAPRLAAFQGLLGCWLEVDPDLAVVDLLVDLLVDPALALTDALASLVPPPSDPSEPLLAPELQALILRALDFLIEDGAARRSLFSVLVAMLAESQAPGLMLGVADVLDAGVLGDLIRLLVTLARKDCTW
jgi:hypothetical protein